eukprot:8794771-Pyramimonas_sp.AAC.2
MTLNSPPRTWQPRTACSSPGGGGSASASCVLPGSSERSVMNMPRAIRSPRAPSPPALRAPRHPLGTRSREILATDQSDAGCMGIFL